MAFRAWGQGFSCQLGPKISFRNPLSDDHTIYCSNVFNRQSACPLCWRYNLRMVLSKPMASFEKIVVRSFAGVWSKCRGIAPSLAPSDPFLVNSLCCPLSSIAIIRSKSCRHRVSNEPERNEHTGEENDAIP